MVYYFCLNNIILSSGFFRDPDSVSTQESIFNFCHLPVANRHVYFVADYSSGSMDLGFNGLGPMFEKSLPSQYQVDFLKDSVRTCC